MKEWLYESLMSCADDDCVTVFVIRDNNIIYRWQERWDDKARVDFNVEVGDLIVEENDHCCNGGGFHCEGSSYSLRTSKIV